MNEQEREEMDFGTSGALWDAGEGVCCAAFQLGACPHTEGEYHDDDDPEPEDAPLSSLFTATYTAEFPRVENAVRFEERLALGGDWVQNVTRKGRTVTFEDAVPVGADVTVRELFQWRLEIVGYYGSTQSRKAKLDGVPAPMSY